MLGQSLDQHLLQSFRLRIALGRGMGLANVRDRLKALYGDRACLTLENKPSGGVVATLDLPREMQAA